MTDKKIVWLQTLLNLDLTNKKGQITCPFFAFPIYSVSCQLLFTLYSSRFTAFLHLVTVLLMLAEVKTHQFLFI